MFKTFTMVKNVFINVLKEKIMVKRKKINVFKTFTTVKKVFINVFKEKTMVKRKKINVFKTFTVVKNVFTNVFKQKTLRKKKNTIVKKVFTMVFFTTPSFAQPLLWKSIQRVKWFLFAETYIEYDVAEK